jgi:hypothetical protein
MWMAATSAAMTTRELNRSHRNVIQHRETAKLSGASIGFKIAPLRPDDQSSSGQWHGQSLPEIGSDRENLNRGAPALLRPASIRHSQRVA